MNVQFRNEDGLIAGELQERIERKLAKLSLLTDSAEESAVATFDLEKEIGAQHTGTIWRASIVLTVNGAQYYAAELAETPDLAANQALKEVRKEIRRAQGKKRALVRKGGSIIKDLTRSSPEAA
jgi:ribosome-associated translation inhibitor RaiA